MSAPPPSLPLSAETETLYRHVLRSAPTDLPGHAEALGWSTNRAEEVMAELERLRLARRGAGGVVRADDPRASVGRLLDDAETALEGRRRHLADLREALETFAADHRRGLQRTGPQEFRWEQLAPGEAAPVVEHLFRTSDGPLLQVTGEVGSGPGHEQAVRRRWEDVAASGRTVRTIFPLATLADPRWQAFVGDRAAAGEEQRYLPGEHIRMDFAVFGRAGVLLDEGAGPGSDLLLLRAAPLVDVFVALFDELWRRAEPALPQDAPAQDRRLLELLALGLKDEAIARQLGLGLRTVRRRVAGLMEEHGADTRFQLGLAVARRGLLGEGRR